MTYSKRRQNSIIEAGLLVSEAREKIRQRRDPEESEILVRAQIRWRPLMGFWSGGSPELMAKKEILRHLWCQKVILLKQGDRIRGQEELHWAVKSDGYILWSWGR